MQVFQKCRRGAGPRVLLLSLCMALALTACRLGARPDVSAWKYHSFEGPGVALLLPDDLEWSGTADAVFRGSCADIQVEIAALDELYADREKLAARVSASTGQDAEVVSVNGVELARAVFPEGSRTAAYYALSPRGEAYRILLAVGEGVRERRGAAVLSAVAGSLCGNGAVPDDAEKVIHPSLSGAEPSGSLDYLVLVNKRSELPEGWEQTLSLVRTANARGDVLTLERTVCEAWFALQKALAAEGVAVDLDAAYGSEGEHRTGLALDLSLGEAAQSPELWARVHARLADFGFIPRYPAGGEYYTGREPEPRHIRYVGVDAAREIAERGITLEEYLGALPAAVDYLVLVNKQNALPDGWEDTVELVYMTNRHGEEIGVERIAYEAYCGLRDALAQEGVHLDINSAYRSVAAQQALAESYRKKYGEAYVKAYVAVPGYSEHHTGLAIDLYLESVDVWAKIHAKLADYGFILRYPEGKESVTGYAYEAWHARYVGVDTAREITERGVTLEEYLGAA